MDKKKSYIDFSSKITIVSFVLSIGIVYQHTAWNYDSNSIVSIVHQCFFFILESFVPLFFMISGYLFFRTYTPDKAKKKLLSRCKSLLVPYIIWNVVYAVFFLTLFKLGFVTNLNVPKGIGNLLLYIFDSRFSPLWFVKYLMIFVLISPPIYCTIS